MVTKSFNAEYMKYWQEAVQKSVDGTIIAGAAICATYLEKLDLRPTDRVLDLGCSFGRLFPAFQKFSSEVYGVDVDAAVVKSAAEGHAYISVQQGHAESTPFANDFFDAVVSWAVFDVVDQAQALNECARILKPQGRLMFTGKNDTYPQDDQLGFVAERNAFLKAFPNKFTSLPSLLKLASEMGLAVQKLFIFSKRGDMGLNLSREVNPADSSFEGYEYLVIFEKTHTPTRDLSQISAIVTSPISRTATQKAQKAGFSNVADFFAKSKEQEGQ